MKTPKIVFKHDVMKDELKHAPYNLTSANVKKIIKDAVRLAEHQAKCGLVRVEKTLKPDKKSDKKKAWKADKLTVQYFGDDKLTVENMKDVRNRLRRCHRRLAEKQLTIRVFPQSKTDSKTTSAQNLGSVFSPKKFKVFSYWFTKDEDERASIIIHELNHDLYMDQKIKNSKGKRVTVYGKTLAKKLARENARKARRSAENYELFCKEAAATS
jgi:hypothetical protein